MTKNLFSGIFFMMVTLLTAVVLTGCGESITPLFTVPTGEGNVYAVAMSDTQNGVEVGYAGLARYTTDGGKMWTHGTNKSACLFAIDLLDDKTCIASGNQHNIVKTTNGGRSWSHLSPLAAILTKGLSFADVTNGWCWAQAVLYETVDGGSTWSVIPLPSGVVIIESAYFFSAGNGLLCDNKGFVFRTSDGGSTWQDVTRVFNNAEEDFKPYIAKRHQCTAIDFDGNKGIIATFGTVKSKAYLKVSTTKDGGATWKTQEPVALIDFPLSMNFNFKHQLGIFNLNSTYTLFDIKVR